MQLESQGRPQDLVLEVERDAAVLAPGAPVRDGPVVVFLGERFDRPLERFAVSQYEVARLVEQEGRRIENMGETHVAREAQLLIGPEVGDVIAPGHRAHPLAAVIERGLAAHRDARHTAYRPQDPDQRRRPEIAVELVETRGEVDHLEGRTVVNLELRRQDAGVPDVLLGGDERPDRLDGEHSAPLGVEKSREDR